MPTTLATPPARSWPGASGRVNLIGDHTDYNDGFVLPMIIDRHVEMVVRRRPDRQVRIVAAESGERVDNTLGEPIDYSSPDWLPYVPGVVHELSQRGRLTSGVDLVFRGTVPQGAGLGSSAALEACERLAAGDLPAFGRLMKASHLSPRNDFEVSHPAIDRLVEEANQVDGVLGARLTGAGFGGCTVNFVAETAPPEFKRRLEPLVDDWSAQSIVVGAYAPCEHPR